jgi:hypothetical protein
VIYSPTLFLILKEREELVMENSIKIEEKNVLRFNVKNSQGEDTGLILKFDLQDIELPLRINNMKKIHEKNKSILKQEFEIINKKENKKGKDFLDWKTEEKIKATRKFYDNDMKALDMLIGQGMTKKILIAIDRFPYYDMFDDIIGALEPVLDKFENEANSMVKDFESKIKNIKEKYGEINEGDTI